MPSLAAITQALANRVRSIRQRRQAVYNEYARLEELAPLRDLFLGQSDDSFTVRQKVAGLVLEAYNANWFDYVGGYSSLPNGVNSNGTADHGFELDFNFRIDGKAVSRTVRGITIQSIGAPAAIWTTYLSSPLKYPVMVTPREQLIPYNADYTASLGITAAGADKPASLGEIVGG